MADVKPEGTGDRPSHLQIKIKSQDGDSVEFKVKPSTKFEKIFTVYCEKKGFNFDQVRFLFDGQHVSKDHDVQSAGLEDGDSIDCVVQQVGGARHTRR